MIRHVFVFIFFCLHLLCFANEIGIQANFIEKNISEHIAKAINKKTVLVKCDFNEKEVLAQIKQDNNYIKKIALEKVDQNKKQFYVSILTTHGHKILLTGNYACYILIPTFKRVIKPSSIINLEEDIENRYFLEKDVNEDTVLNLNELKGVKLNRNIQLFSPINKKYVINKIIVNQNDIVKVIYKHKSLFITSFGIALDRGSMGGIIRVKDAKNKSIIYTGKIVDDKTVEIF